MYESEHHLVLDDDENRHGQKHDVLEERLPVGEHKCIAKASTIRHRVVDSHPDGYDGHCHHKEGCCSRHPSSPPHSDEEVDAEDGLHEREHYTRKIEQVFRQIGESDGSGIVFKFDDESHWVVCLSERREEESERE